MARSLTIAFDLPAEERRPPARSEPRPSGRFPGRTRNAARQPPDMLAAEETPVLLLARCRLDSGAVCAVEAVLPAAGRLGVAVLLGRIAGLARAATPHGRLAVVLSGSELAVAGLAGQLGAALACSPLDAERLELMLPEAALAALDEPGVLALAALRDAGVALTLDGFGAGLASLTMLRRLPLSAIRLARVLVRGLPGNAEDAAIARAAIATAHAMGLSVIGDGIEREAQRGFLAHCGCDEGQGPLFGTFSRH